MLDARRDCRYRRGPHRNIGVGLGKVTFHNKPGTSSGVPGFPLTLIHPSAWRDCPKRVGGACDVALRSTETVLFDPFWSPCASQIHAKSVVRTPFRTVSPGTRVNKGIKKSPGPRLLETPARVTLPAREGLTQQTSHALPVVKP